MIRDLVTWERVRRLVETGDHCGAIDVYERVERERPLRSSELVELALCVLRAATEESSFDQAERRLREALEYEPDYAPALNGLGWLYLEVYEQPEIGLRYFEEAKSAVARELEEAQVGIEECLRRRSPAAHAAAANESGAPASSSRGAARIGSE